MNIKERLVNAANKYAGITPERHRAKVEHYSQLAADTEIEGQHTVYDVLDAESIGENVRFTAGAASPYFLALGLFTITSAIESGDFVKGTIGTGLMLLSIGTSKMSIRAIDNSRAIEQVLAENFNSVKSSYTVQ